MENTNIINPFLKCEFSNTGTLNIIRLKFYYFTNFLTVNKYTDKYLNASNNFKYLLQNLTKVGTMSVV